MYDEVCDSVSWKSSSHGSYGRRYRMYLPPVAPRATCSLLELVCFAVRRCRGMNQAGCGECGGSGCSSRGSGLDGDDCCQSNIKKNGDKCSETGTAPCIVDGERRDIEIESIKLMHT